MAAFSIGILGNKLIKYGIHISGANSNYLCEKTLIILK